MSARCPYPPVEIHRRPGHPLSDWVDSLWYFEDSACEPTRERLLPRGSVELIIELGEGRSSIVEGDRRVGVDRASITGAASRPRTIERSGPCETVGVILKPGAIAALTDVPANELAGTPVPLTELWGSGAGQLPERASQRPTPDEKLDEVARVLAEQLRRYQHEPPARLRAAVARLNAAPARWRIDELSDDLGISRRRLEELCRAGVGLSPKQLQRLARFRQALEGIGRAREVGWSTFALELGYYDQAHFGNEFRRHAEMAPDAYLAAKRPFLNHVSLGAA